MKFSNRKLACLPFMLWGVYAIPVNADTVFFDGTVMHVPELLVFQEERPQLLKQVELQKKKANSFELVHAGDLDYANVQSISADSEIVSGDPLVVDLSGEKSLECVTLNPVSVSRLGNDFHLVVTEQPVPAHVSCIAVTAPFTLTGTIETTSLAAGTYGIHAHGLHIDVTVTE